MKNLLKRSVIILGLALYSMPVSQANAAECPRSGDAIDLVELGNTLPSDAGDYNCDFTPDGMQIQIHKLMMCQEPVGYQDYLDKCHYILDAPNGKLATISLTEITSLLDGSASLPEGEYTHTIVMIDPTINTIFQETYSAPVLGNNGTGTTCWSNGNQIQISYEQSPNGDGDTTKFAASCGASSDANPAWSPYTYKAFWNEFNQGTDYYTNKLEYLAAGLGDKNVYIMATETEIADISMGDLGRNDDDYNGVTSDAEYVLGITELANPVSIGPLTKNIDVSFALENMYSQKITTNNNYYNTPNSLMCSQAQDIIGASSDTGAHACLASAAPAGFNFQVSVQ